MIKNTILKAIHNQDSVGAEQKTLRIMSKNTILKAIHNCGFVLLIEEYLLES